MITTLANIDSTRVDFLRDLRNAAESDHPAVKRRYADLISEWSPADDAALDALSELTSMVDGFEVSL